MDSSRMRLSRRAFSLASAGLPMLSLLPKASWAAAFPDRSIKFVVPFNPGGNVDAVGRLLAAAMTASLHQAVVVENRAGAGGSLGATFVAQSPADGYTVMVGSNGPLTINPFVQAKLQYKPLEDFAPIALAGLVPHAFVVNNDLPAHNLQELIALSKKQSVGCGTSGIGSATHLTLARFNAQTGARIEHVPYRGGNSLVPDLLGGSVQVASMEMSTALALHKGGKARILAIAGAQRSPLLPEVPTFIEAGVKGFIAESYVGLLAPAHTPPAVLAVLEKAAIAAIGSADTGERLLSLGMQVAAPADRGAAGFGKLLRADYAASRDAVKLAGVVPE